ncbi:MAG: 50S ribosomal protein L16 [Candidatus Micrarchaeota archaeon]|nr:50S ribosomal protein L16 [Candidatus Micrarchaeota archaeon]MDE1804451.1 50S ribosomal protein L16 [Candidatus Micrarchaeota archaeon]MDE1847079.1 50S ribosomal protein L16 [Candidatus Micrarchaeota archaeon]
MARIRPGRAVRKINSQAWSRYSVSKPRKNFVKALPHTSLLVFNMGVKKGTYNMTMNLVSEQNVQLRSNALEAARQVTNKYLEREIPNAYSLRIVPYPHSVLREKKFATGAGADRISQGMTLSFGRPTAVAARVFRGNTIFELKTNASNRRIGQTALRRAAAKLSGTYKIKVQEAQAAQPAQAAA